MINNIFSSSNINNNYPPAMNSGTAPVSGLTPPAYGTDGFTPTTNYSNTALSSGGMSYPISQIISEDPAMASKFGKFFMGSSTSFLRVGSTWFGKAVINLVAGNIPLLTSKTTSTAISNNINLWLGRSDLVRSGATPFQASLLQDVGIKNVTDLAVVTNPSDQAVLSQMMTAASGGRGQPVMITPGMVAGWAAAAQQLPKYF